MSEPRRRDDLAADLMNRPSTSTAHILLTLSLPAIVMGVVSALVLFGIDTAAEWGEHLLWSTLPGALGLDAASGWWIFGVLSVIGLAVGLTVWLMPGHGGHDSATVELVAPPLPLSALPSLLIVTMLALAGGVSLGPESPIIAINTAILVSLFSRVWPAVPLKLVVLVTAAGTVGALFATPVAAALVFTGMVASILPGEALWNKLFLPLLSAGAGALTMSALASPSFNVGLPDYDTVAPIDIVSLACIATLAALLGLAAAAVFPHIHAAFRLLRNPVIYITLGGMLLGVLGAIGGPITLFKGLQQMREIVDDRDDYSAATLGLVVAVKIVALVVSAAAGFRGGRIFPAVFIGVAIGLLSHALLPGIPLTVAVAGGLLGMVLAIARDGWIAIFIAVAVTGSAAVLPGLCLAILPVWLLVSRGPEMIVHHAAGHQQEEERSHDST